MKVLVRIPVSPYSGYGNDGIGLTEALLRWGADVYLHPTNVDPPLPNEVARLLTKDLTDGVPYDLYINHVSPDLLSVSPEAKASSNFTLGWTMWEYSSLEHCSNLETMKERLAHFDALASYDAVTKGAMDEYAPSPSFVLQGGYDPSDWPYVERDWHGERFSFGMNGQLHERKDPFVAIQAFQELKNDPEIEFEGAEMHLHTTVPGLHPMMEKWCPKLRVHYVTWTKAKLREFYASQHVLLAPSRGEGKNLPALEFMSTGGTVIATNWGGHTGWLSSEYAYPLDYVLRPADPNSETAQNARASKDHLKELMLHAYRNRGEVQNKAEIAARTIPAMCSWDAVVERLFLNLAQNVEGGQRVHDLAMASRIPPKRWKRAPTKSEVEIS